MSATSSTVPEGVLSPTGTGSTPLPVVAQWFTHSDIEKKTKSHWQTGQVKPELTDTGTDETRMQPLLDDVDTRSVKSDATVIEKKAEEPPEPVNLDTGAQEQSCVISVPQSPSEIRKKFQQNTSFQKSYLKSAEFELSKEFKEGVRGKVRESKESFFKRSNTDKLAEAKEKRESELETIKLQRSDSRNFEDDTRNRAQQMRQEKQQELEQVKRSRSSSKFREDLQPPPVSQEQLERQTELASLAHRKLDIEDAYLFSPTELREIELREERERELANLSKRQNFADTTSASEDRARKLKAERHQELQALASRNVDSQEQNASQTETLRHERSEELREIANLRSNSINDTDTAVQETEKARSTPDMDCTDEMRGRVRGTAALWQQREQSAGRDHSRAAASRDSRSACTTPTRRIGSMFRRDPEYWGSEEELPAPPEELTAPQDASNPPPPPRQSSRGKMEEYKHWSGGWRNMSPTQTHHKLH